MISLRVPWVGKLIGQRWVGVLGCVLALAPPSPDDAALLAHETVHIDRQDALGRRILSRLGLGWALRWRPFQWWARVLGTRVWLTRYFTSKSFRLNEEVIAFVDGDLPLYPEAQQPFKVRGMAYDLSDEFYDEAAPSPQAALAAIEAALKERGRALPA